MSENVRQDDPTSTIESPKQTRTLPKTLAESEVDALIKVLPRMTYPALTAQELTAMNLPDMLSLAAKVIGFLSPASAE